MPQELQTSNPLGTLSHILTQYQKQIEMAIPKHLTVERMIRITLTAVSRSPKLMQCDPYTVCGAVVQAGILGLEPNAELGEAFLVPYKNNKRRDKQGRPGVYECQLQVGYKGHMKLAQNSGEISRIDAELVYTNDMFDFELGSDPKISHRPPKAGPRGDLIGCWAGFKTKGGEYSFKFMTIDELIAHRDRYTKSKDAQGEIYGAWIDSPDWMFKKTVLIQVLKLAPKSVALATAVALTEQSEAMVPQRVSINLPDGTEIIPQPPVEDEDQGDQGGDQGTAAEKTADRVRRRVMEQPPEQEKK